VPQGGFVFSGIVFAEVADFLHHLSHLPEGTTFPEVFGGLKVCTEDAGCHLSVNISEPDETLSTLGMPGYMVGAF
jgi:hypothetical protein